METSGTCKYRAALYFDLPMSSSVQLYGPLILHMPQASMHLTAMNALEG